MRAAIIYLGLSLCSMALANTGGFDFERSKDEYFILQPVGDMNSCAMLLADREARDLYVAKLMRTVTDELVAVAQDPKAKNYFDSQTGQIEPLNLNRTKIIHQIWRKQQNSDLSQGDFLSILLGYADATGTYRTDRELIAVSRRVSPELFLTVLEYVLTHENRIEAVGVDIN